MDPVVIDEFEIPEDLARELSDLLARQSIRERLLQTLIGKPEYDEVENSIVPLVSKIDAIKTMITLQYVPDKYRSEKFMWNYPGWEVSQNRVQIANT